MGINDYDEVLISVTGFKARCFDELVKVAYEDKKEGMLDEEIYEDIASALYYFSRTAEFVKGA